MVTQKVEVRWTAKISKYWDGHVGKGMGKVTKKYEWAGEGGEKSVLLKKAAGARKWNVT